jgi:hypothetical protein|tara:strand:- start:1313 stop:1669 length:357 start_codon:yes stop_codon:yes gene_type:complete
MDDLIKNTTRNTSQFTVAIDQINNSKALLPHVLYKEMVAFVLESTDPLRNIIVSKPTLNKIHILKNAFLNDILLLNSSIKKLGVNELQLSVEVYKNSNNDKDIICNASFILLLKEKYN